MRSPRTAAALAIAAVIDQHLSLGDALEANRAAIAGRDRALVHELAYGVCRRFFELDAVLQRLMPKPLRQKDADIRALLLMGMFQLRYMRVPDHAAVAETVASTRQLKKNWASGLVNAVLRAFRSRETELYLALPEAAQLAHPEWLLARIKKAWPDHYRQIIDASNTAPEMALRVNRRRGSRETCLAQMQAQSVVATPGELSADALLLSRGMDVEKIPGFSEGLVSVQDQAAQLAAPLLRCEAGQRVLDACAAPGGKTCHLLELHELDLLALDASASRLERIGENLRRLGLSCIVQQADAREPASWWNGVAFDRILLDAPCSATGVIRRHPDIRMRRDPEQIVKATEQQRALLQGLWSCLATDGLLLYGTCSILPEENELLVASFVQATPGAEIEPLNFNGGIERTIGRQLLPLSGSNDGFYYALLRKA